MNCPVAVLDPSDTVTVSRVALSVALAFPEIVPVLELKVRPAGSAGVIE